MSVAAGSRPASLAPASWLRLPRRTARLRLTLLYGGLFLVLGTCMLVLVYGFASHSSSVETAVPFARTLVAPHFHAGAVAQQSADNARLLAGTWLALAVTTVVAALLGWIAAGRVLRPLRTITDTARTISAGNLHERLALTGPDGDEFKQLGDTLDDLFGRLETSFEAQRRFVANASHELRTPLTFERTRLQVALADPAANAETLRAACEEVLASGAEQEQLLESLLTLAASERGLDQAVSVDLCAAVQDELHEPRPAIERLSLQVDSALEAATVAGDPALVKRLVANLLDNAVGHNVPGGRVSVRTDVQDGRPTLSVTNTGIVIEPDAVERLFEPFVRLGARSAVAGDDGYGLGLSIVRAIANAHDASVEATAQPDGGLAVAVSWPQR